MSRYWSILYSTSSDVQFFACLVLLCIAMIVCMCIKDNVRSFCLSKLQLDDNNTICERGQLLLIIVVQFLTLQLSNVTFHQWQTAVSLDAPCRLQIMGMNALSPVTMDSSQKTALQRRKEHARTMACWVGMTWFVMVCSYLSLRDMSAINEKHLWMYSTFPPAREVGTKYPVYRINISQYKYRAIPLLIFKNYIGRW